MGYRESLEAAGAKVVTFRNFGDWEGSWWALVMYNGETGWASGGFGSCSGCDAFESEFDTRYWNKKGHDNPEYREALVKFGRSYLDHLMTQEEAELDAEADADWDLDADLMLLWLQQFRGMVLIPISL
jgi:hypothetical protein